MKTETKHTPGPWKEYGQAIYTEARRAHWVSGRDARQSLIANVRDNYDEDPENVIDNPPSIAEAEANASRIVACVNGCEGIADPSAVRELLEALESAGLFLSQWVGVTAGSKQAEARDAVTVKISAAIAKARGLEGGVR